MSSKQSKKRDGRGGPRKGAGRPPAPAKLVKNSVALSPAQQQKLERLSSALKVSKAQVIRQAVDAYNPPSE